MSVPRTDRSLAMFLRGLSPASRSRTHWLGGLVQLRVSGYLANDTPPVEYITSARSLVITGNQVLVQHDQSGHHVLPGGRLEPGEAPEAAMRREVLEETGWHVGPAALLGFMRFRHLTPRPADYLYPYPDFIQIVYVADALERHDGAKIDDGWEIGSMFQEMAVVRRVKLPAGQRLFLEAGLKLRGMLSLRASEQI